jgi:hypothetical protein
VPSSGSSSVPAELHANRMQWLIRLSVIHCYVSVMWRPGTHRSVWLHCRATVWLNGEIGKKVRKMKEQVSNMKRTAQCHIPEDGVMWYVSPAVGNLAMSYVELISKKCVSSSTRIEGSGVQGSSCLVEEPRNPSTGSHPQLHLFKNVKIWKN